MNIKTDLLPLLWLGIITITNAHENNQHIKLFHHRHAIPCPFVRPSQQFDNSNLNCSTFKMPLINTYVLSYSIFGEIVWHSLFLSLIQSIFALVVVFRHMHVYKFLIAWCCCIAAVYIHLKWFRIVDRKRHQINCVKQRNAEKSGKNRACEKIEQFVVLYALDNEREKNQQDPTMNSSR